MSVSLQNSSQQYNTGPVKLWVLKAAYILGPLFNILNIGGVRSDPLPDHPSGHALDFMITQPDTPAGFAQGNALANFAVQHHDELGIKYLIWNKQYWDPQQGWGPYTAPSEIAYNPHTNHVHITFLDQPGSWTGGSALTPQQISQAVLTSAPGADNSSTCAWNLSLPSVGPIGGGNVCVLNKKTVRQLVGVLLLMGGGIVFLAGIGVLVAYGLGKTNTPLSKFAKLVK